MKTPPPPPPPTKEEEQLERLAEALDSEDDDGGAAVVVANLGINVKAMADGIRSRVAAADAADRKQRIADARVAYAKEVEALERRPLGGGAGRMTTTTRDEQLVIFEALLAKVPQGRALGMHFHKYEAASKEELAEMIRSLRHLLSSCHLGGEKENGDE